MKCAIYNIETRFLVETDTASYHGGKCRSFLVVKRPERGALLCPPPLVHDSGGVLKHG
jgi:hypothetical protein